MARLLETFRERNPDYRIDIVEELIVQYGYDRENRRTETGQQWQCFLVVGEHRVSILYSRTELDRVNPESSSGRSIYEGILVHANRYLTQYGIQLR